MKFSLIAALVVVLAVAHGSEAMTLVKRDVQSEMDMFAKIINEMSAGLTSATQDMLEKMKAVDVTDTAQTYMEDSRTKILPLVEKVQAEAAKLQEHVRPFVTNIEGQVKPLSEVMEQFFQQVVDQTKSLLPSQ